MGYIAVHASARISAMAAQERFNSGEPMLQVAPEKIPTSRRLTHTYGIFRELSATQLKPMERHSSKSANQPSGPVNLIRVPVSADLDDAFAVSLARSFELRDGRVTC